MIGNELSYPNLLNGVLGMDRNVINTNNFHTDFCRMENISN